MAEIKFLKGSIENWNVKTDINQDYFYVVNDTLTGKVSLYLGDKLLANGADASDLSQEIADRIAGDQALQSNIESLEDSMLEKIAEEIAKVIDEAPEDFNTLKEIADYIASDKTNAAEMSNKIAANETAIANEQARAQEIEAILSTSIADEKTRAMSAESNISTAIATETARAEAEERSLSDAISEEITRAKAKEEELASLISDEENRAIAAETALGERIDTLSSSSHSHDNKTVLDGITSDKVSAWDVAEQNAKYYADSLASNYDAAGSAAQALVDARTYADEQDIDVLASSKEYADSLASNYDAAGSAEQALADATELINGVSEAVHNEIQRAVNAENEIIDGYTAAVGSLEGMIVEQGEKLDLEILQRKSLSGSDNVVVTLDEETGFQTIGLQWGTF